MQPIDYLLAALSIICIIVLIVERIASYITKCLIWRETRDEMIEAAHSASNEVLTSALGFVSPIGLDGEANSTECLCQRCVQEFDWEADEYVHLERAPYQSCSNCGFRPKRILQKDEAPASPFRFQC